MSFLGSLFGTDDAEKAVKRAAAANRQEAKNAYSETQTIQQPFYDTGVSALSQYGDALGLNGQGAQQGFYDSYVASPDVQFRLGQGIKAIDNSYAARSGGTPSGGLLKALTNYGTGVATQDLSNYLARLAGVAGSGQTAANELQSARYGSAGLTTNANTTEGNAIANASLAQGSILGNLINGGLGLAGQIWNPFASKGRAGVY